MVSYPANYVPLVVPGLPTGSASSATPTPPTASSQDYENSTMRPATMRSESVSERAQGDPLPELPEWLQEFKENLVEESVPEHGDARELFSWVTRRISEERSTGKTSL